MSQQLMTHTQQAVILSLNFITEDTNGTTFSVMPLLSLTWSLMAIWSIRQAANRFRFTLAMLKGDIKNWLNVTGKIATIGFNSLVWGVMV